MPKYILATGEPHPNSINNTCAPLPFAVGPDDDPEYEAMRRIWVRGGTDPERLTAYFRPPTKDQWAELKRAGTLTIKPIANDGDDESRALVASIPEDARIVLWYRTGDISIFDTPDIGFGYSHDGTVESGMDRYDNTWVCFHGWEPPTGRRLQLEAMSKTDLVWRILLLESRFGYGSSE